MRKELLTIRSKVILQQLLNPKDFFICNCTNSRKVLFGGKYEGASTENSSERWTKINRAARKYKDKYDIKLVREKVHKVHKRS